MTSRWIILQVIPDLRDKRDGAVFIATPHKRLLRQYKTEESAKEYARWFAYKHPRSKYVVREIEQITINDLRPNPKKEEFVMTRKEMFA